MSNTPETKVVEQIANLAESHWFNGAILGRQLAEQPLYTLDRIMEMVVHILRNQSIRHKQEAENGITSEGLLLANELYNKIGIIQKQYNFTNLKLPK
jgi:hypothetical protein